MKARVYNHIRRFLYKQNLDKISPASKIQFFDEIFNMNHKTHWELKDYKWKRKQKDNLYKERVARGYKFKKKTSKAEYEKMKKNLVD